MKLMTERLKDNEPYNLFFTTIPESPETLTQQNSITFTDLLCPSLGELKCSLQLNFIIYIDWLVEQYEKAGQGGKPLTILHGYEQLEYDVKKKVQLLFPHVTEHFVKTEDPFGIHHSKVGIYVYNDNSLRVVVSTANLYDDDWDYYCNGLWISPLCRRLLKGSSDKDGESPTFFKSTLISYLQNYKLDILESWIDFVRHANFSDIRVFLTTSVPGTHSIIARHSHLHIVGRLLSNHCTFSVDEDPLLWDVLAQASSTGYFGTNAEWLHSTLLRSLASFKDYCLPANPDIVIKIVFPTKNNVLESYRKEEGGDSLQFHSERHIWLKKCLYQWKADCTYRSKAMPHIKTYCRISPCMTKLAWFLLTSANISRSAWGGIISRRGTSYLRSYEVGVLFLPGFFNEQYFQIKDVSDQKRLFPFIYDLPLTPYGDEDRPWINE